jgi:deoxyribodipyrimidine photo-lyase
VLASLTRDSSTDGWSPAVREDRRFDPDGTYVRRLVPELAGIEGRAIHEPWKLNREVRGRLDYPDPLVPPPS